MGGLGLSSFCKQQGGVGGADLRFFLPLWGQLRKVLETLCTRAVKAGTTLPVLLAVDSVAPRRTSDASEQ